MTLVRFDPYRGFEKMGKRMNQFISEFEKGFSLESNMFNPRVDITEDEKFIHVHSEMPGIDKDDVKIAVNEDNILTIKGEKKQNQEFKDKNFLRTERNFGSFTRSFVLPENLNLDNIEAKFENGVLEIAIPKVEPKQPTEVEIKIS